MAAMGHTSNDVITESVQESNPEEAAGRDKENHVSISSVDTPTAPPA